MPDAMGESDCTARMNEPILGLGIYMLGDAPRNSLLNRVPVIGMNALQRFFARGSAQVRIKANDSVVFL